MPPEYYATLALVNGKIVTVDPNNAIYEAVAVRENKIIAVGNTNNIKKHVGPETEVIELGGKAVLPGFIDSHVHLVVAGRLAVKVSPSAGVMAIRLEAPPLTA